MELRKQLIFSHRQGPQNWIPNSKYRFGVTSLHLTLKFVCYGERKQWPAADEFQLTMHWAEVQSCFVRVM